MLRTYPISLIDKVVDWFKQLPPAILIIYGITLYVIVLAAQSLVMAIDYRLMLGQTLFAGSLDDPLYEMGTGLGFWSILFFCLNFLLATRWRWIENLFGGMDKAYQLHGLVGKLGMFFVLAHTGILIVQALPDTQLVNRYLLPGLDLGYTLGVVGVVAMTGLVAATIWIKMPYGTWLNSHKWMIVPYLAGTGHAFVLQQDWYMLVLSAVGGYAWFYSTFLYRHLAPQALGKVESYSLKNTINDVHIRFDDPFKAEAGQFVYLSVTGSQMVNPELHPFSISGQSADGIRLSIKTVGDYTATLKELRPGDKVKIYGPYGHFGKRSFAAKRPQVWLAGGIGITPFLSLLQHAVETPRSHDVVLIWSVRERKDAVFVSEIEQWCQQVAGVRFELHVSCETGYLTAETISQMVTLGRLQASDILVCGPDAMMRSLTRQLTDLAIPRSRIITEAFAMKK